jgi:hypothetical protein
MPRRKREKGSVRNVSSKRDIFKGLIKPFTGQENDLPFEFKVPEGILLKNGDHVEYEVVNGMAHKLKKIRGARR